VFARKDDLTMTTSSSSLSATEVATAIPLSVDGAAPVFVMLGSTPDPGAPTEAATAFPLPFSVAGAPSGAVATWPTPVLGAPAEAGAVLALPTTARAPDALPGPDSAPKASITAFWPGPLYACLMALQFT